jgi:hypothetical protein
MRRHLAILAVPVLLLLNACGSVTLNMANQRFISPETAGFRMDTGMEGVTPVTLADASTVPPDLTTHFGDKNSEADFFLGGSIGVVHHLDLWINWDPGGVPVFGLKFQLIGPSRKDAHDGAFSLAVTGGGGVVDQGSSDPGNAWSYSRLATAADASVIAGLRTNHAFLIYGGPFITSYEIHGTIRQPADTGTAFPYEGKGLQKGINLGLEISPGGFLFGKFHMKVEGAFVDSTFGALHRQAWSGGLCGGVAL